MLSKAEKVEFVRLLEEKERRIRYRKIDSYFQDQGPLRRELYQKHLEFFKVGKSYRERCFMAGNRVGKTESAGGYELTLHLTGQYPGWWQGKTFDRAIIAWAAGDTTETTRNILQPKILGPINEIGTGLIPKAAIIDTKSRSSNVPDAIESVKILHTSGGISALYFKSYDQKRRSFQGTEIDVILLDEECPMDIYSECLLRTMGISNVREAGIIMLTFTPLMGITELVQTFMPGAVLPQEQKGSKYLINATWDDVPHLSKEERQELIDAMPPYQKDARTKGIPALGSGAIYPIAEEDVLIDDFRIPAHYPKAFALDVGWNANAAVWGAWDLETDTIYLYSEYLRGQAEPAVHAAAIKSRGDWIKGVCDRAAGSSSQRDGKRLIEEYRGLGLDMIAADNSVEAGIFAVYERLTTGRLKIFKSLVKWLEEFRLYRRDEKGKVVKEKDHLMDATRYLCMSGYNVASTGKPKYEPIPEIDYRALPGYGSSISERM